MAGRDDPEHLEQPMPMQPRTTRLCKCDATVDVEFVIEYRRCDECKAEGCQHDVKEFDNNIKDKQVLLLETLTSKKRLYLLFCEDCEKLWRRGGNLHKI